ncbi:MAG: DUF5107 domain-containing protein [Clostridiales bacterium]|nr:DUF5107 domain-containing protein [Clostridiales bacterium]
MQKTIVRDEIRLIPYYGEPEAEAMPMFAENRVHQRSSGNPYPNRVVMEVKRAECKEHPFRVITLENEYLCLELLPELGGRIYSALDKRTGYDFFYRQHVIKPALIGLLGSWISGGVEFNWPCHHRPSTFMPVDYQIETEPSGAVTVWMSEHEPLNRMKGMVGIRLAPGEARFDTRMKVYNRTPVRHSFLWWENAAVPVNEQYRLVFPPDVHYVQFHYRKNVTSYPVASGVYNGIRMGNGVDISYHKNTRQPTSYFCAETAYSFFGGYDEGKHCGVIHVADRTVSVGKKMFTWAYNQLSKSWEHALTDTDGAYAELMASSYSLNQPDFAWLMPYEGKEFSQMWYPVGDLGLPFCACAEAAFSLSGNLLSVQASVPLEARLEVGDMTFPLQLSPDKICRLELNAPPDAFVFRGEDGQVLLRYAKPSERSAAEMPATIPDNPTLDALHSAQELYLLGVHAEQYRDPAVLPDAYWREALRRDPDFVPALTSLASWELEHDRPQEAYLLARHAWEQVTVRNFHPESGELQYVMGRILEALGQEDDAWSWYMQSAWAQDSRSRALTRAAMIEGRRGNSAAMADLSAKAVEAHPFNETAQCALALACRQNPDRMRSVLSSLLSRDPLSLLGRAIQLGPVPAFYASLHSNPTQSLLDLAQDLSELGENRLACELLQGLPGKCAQTEYVRWYLGGDADALAKASVLDPGIAYPSRPVEYKALSAAVKAAPEDGRARNLLACLLYHHGNHKEAAQLWEKAASLHPADYSAFRNLAVAMYSHLHQREKALPLLEKALSLRPQDGQLIWETGYVMLHTHRAPSEVAEFLEKAGSTREDICIERCLALNLAGRHDEVLNIMARHSFTPCEGGEHAVAEQYMFAHHAIGRHALSSGDPETALQHFLAAQVLPDHLGAGLWNEVLLVPHRYFEAVCLFALGKQVQAQSLLDWILLLKQDYFSDMHLPELPCYQAMAHLLRKETAPAQELIAAHLRSQDTAQSRVDPGWRKTTPFFISYMEEPSLLRRAICDWQRAMAYFAAGDLRSASAFASRALDNDPVNLYATLLI